jgi:hypothetical protein
MSLVDLGNETVGCAFDRRSRISGGRISAKAWRATMRLWPASNQNQLGILRHNSTSGWLSSGAMMGRSCLRVEALDIASRDRDQTHMHRLAGQAAGVGEPARVSARHRRLFLCVRRKQIEFGPQAEGGLPSQARCRASPSTAGRLACANRLMSFAVRRKPVPGPSTSRRSAAGDPDCSEQRHCRRRRR